jgi:peptidoglycan/LPS O-acetylase OafA/YrhL
VFYLLSRYVHSAVVVFFLLSGYLVGGSIIRSTASGRWSWRDYLLARGVRLYLALAPALLLTMVWDRIGLGIASGSQGNNDTARAIVTAPEIATNSGLVPFVGNLAFLQTIAVPNYGSNFALWSSANEGWYYRSGAD